MVAKSASVLKRMVQIEVVSHLVGEGAMARAGRGSDVAQVVVTNHNTVLSHRYSAVRERRIAQYNTAGGDAGELNVSHHPDIEVLSVGPIEFGLDGIVGRK